MKLMNEASNLGKEIAASKEYMRYLEAEKRYKEDTRTREQIKKFKEKQKMLSSVTEYGNDTDPKEVRKELAGLFEEIEKNQTIIELNNSLSEFIILKRKIYERIESLTNIDDEVFLFNSNCGGCKKNCDGCK